MLHIEKNLSQPRRKEQLKEMGRCQGVRKDRDQKSAFKNKTKQNCRRFWCDIGHFVKHWITLKVPNFKTAGKTRNYFASAIKAFPEAAPWLEKSGVLFWNLVK